jgi:hypothetical protein
LRDASLGRIGVTVAQPAGISGEVTLIAPSTLEAIADAALDAGLATAEELGEIVDELYALAADDATFMSIPRVVRAWGASPARDPQGSGRTG